MRVVSPDQAGVAPVAVATQSTTASHQGRVLRLLNINWISFGLALLPCPWGAKILKKKSKRKLAKDRHRPEPLSNNQVQPSLVSNTWFQSSKSVQLLRYGRSFTTSFWLGRVWWFVPSGSGGTSASSSFTRSQSSHACPKDSARSEGGKNHAMWISV